MTTEEMLKLCEIVAVGAFDRKKNFVCDKFVEAAANLAHQVRTRLTESAPGVEERGDELATPRGDEETELPGMWDKSDLTGGETDCLPPPDTGTEPDELPGALALQLAVQRGDWPHTMDANIWADKFAEAVAADPTITSDRGMMIGWFANAIMAGYDTAAQRLPSAATPPTDALVEALPEKEYLLSVIRNYHENGHECDECPPDHAEDKCPLWERAKSAGRSMTPTTHTESDKG